MSLLVPHPRRIAGLIADTGSRTGPYDAAKAADAADGQRRATPVRDPGLRRRGRRGRPRGTPPLRLVETSPHAADIEAGRNGEVTLLLEFDAAPGDAPNGCRWLDLDAEVIARLEPETARAAAASWARERADGWSPLRPQWSARGGSPHASTWLVDQMVADGRPALGAPRVHQLWGLSVVLVAPSSDGNVFFKCSADVFRHEAVATQTLAAQTPESLPEVVAVDAGRGWLLMRDLGAADLGDQDQSLWHEGLVAHARIQQSWLKDRRAGRSRAAGPVADRPGRAGRGNGERRHAAGADAGRHAGTVAGDRPGPGPVLSAPRRDRTGPDTGARRPPSMERRPRPNRHARLRLDRRRRVAPIRRSRHLRVQDRRPGRTSAPGRYACQRLVDRELGAVASRGGSLGLVVGALYQVQTYLALLPTLMGNGADDGLAGGDLSLDQAQPDALRAGLESPA